MVPSSYQHYFNSTSTLFQHYFNTFKVKNEWRTSGEGVENDWSHTYPTLVEMRDETCQTLVIFFRSSMIDLRWQNPIWLRRDEKDAAPPTSQRKRKHENRKIMI